METKEEKIKKLKHDYSTIVESLSILGDYMINYVGEVIFTDIEPKDFQLLLDVEHLVLICRQKMRKANSGVNKISNIIE